MSRYGFFIAMIATSVLSHAVAADGYEPAGKGFALSPPVSWSGLYIGGHAGYGWADADAQLTGTDPEELRSAFDFLGASSSGSTELDAWLGGGQIGLQRQFDQLVLGAEATLSGGDLQGATSSSFEGAFRNVTSSFFADEVEIVDIVRTDWAGQTTLDMKVSELFTATARVGYVWNDWLAYFKGGYASADVRVRSGLSGSGAVCDIVFGCADLDLAVSSRSKERHNGWTVGGGLEKMISPNIVLGVEYSYLNLGSELHNGRGEATIGLGNFDIDGSVTTTTRVDPDAIHAAYLRFSILLNRPSESSTPLK